MKSDVNILLPVLMMIIVGIACSEPQTSSKTGSSDLNLFPPEEACNYPSNSSILKFRELGGGKWRRLVVGGTDLGYDCGETEKKVYLVSPSTDAFVEYGVLGTKEGAKSLGFDYDVHKHLTNEPDLRQEFTILLDEVTKQALNAPLPETVKSKILDLKTYSGTGVRNTDIFTVGEGRLEMSRNANPSTPFVLVKVSICPNKNVACN